MRRSIDSSVKSKAKSEFNQFSSHFHLFNQWFYPEIHLCFHDKTPVSASIPAYFASFLTLRWITSLSMAKAFRSTASAPLPLYFDEAFLEVQCR